MTNIITQSLRSQITKHLRLLHLSAAHNGQAKTMKKVMGGSSKKKFKYHEAPLLPSPAMFSKGSMEGKQSINSKRATVLNKLFMRYVTDLMATGECSTAFVGHGIEINRVQITPDFSCVHIFWIAKGTEKDIEIDALLNKNAGSLRHELAQLKVVGVIPKLKFVKDKIYAQAVAVDRLLSKADYGEDYIPVDLSAKLKTEMELRTNLEPHILMQIEKLDSNAELEEHEEVSPPMPHNVFGLNHSEILERILKSKKKTQALHRLEPEEETARQIVNENPIQYANISEEREAFKEFLRKRQILKSKADRADKNYNAQLELMEKEWSEEQERLYSNYDFENIDDADFIEEDFDKNSK